VKDTVTVGASLGTAGTVEGTAEAGEAAAGEAVAGEASSSELVPSGAEISPGAEGVTAGSVNGSVTLESCSNAPPPGLVRPAPPLSPQARPHNPSKTIPCFTR